MYPLRLLARIRRHKEVEIHLILSRAGEKTLFLETGKLAADLKVFADYCWPLEDISAPIGGVQVLALQGGNPVPGLNVTIAIGANPGSGTLTGFATAATNANGVATFPNLRLNANGVGYTLIASASGAAQIISNVFNIGVTPPILTFQAQPTNTILNQGISAPTGVQVLVQQGGSPVVGLNVTLAIGTNPGGGTLGGLVKTALA